MFSIFKKLSVILQGQCSEVSLCQWTGKLMFYGLPNCFPKDSAFNRLIVSRGVNTVGAPIRHQGGRTSPVTHFDNGVASELPVQQHPEYRAQSVPNWPPVNQQPHFPNTPRVWGAGLALL